MKNLMPSYIGTPLQPTTRVCTRKWASQIQRELPRWSTSALRCTIKNPNGVSYVIFLPIDEYEIETKKGAQKRKTFNSLDIFKNTYEVNQWIQEKEYSQRIKYIIDRNTGHVVISMSAKEPEPLTDEGLIRMLSKIAARAEGNCVEK